MLYSFDHHEPTLNDLIVLMFMHRVWVDLRTPRMDEIQTLFVTKRFNKMSRNGQHLLLHGFLKHHFFGLGWSPFVYNHVFLLFIIGSCCFFQKFENISTCVLRKLFPPDNLEPKIILYQPRQRRFPIQGFQSFSVFQAGRVTWRI